MSTEGDAKKQGMIDLKEPLILNQGDNVSDKSPAMSDEQEPNIPPY